MKKILVILLALCATVTLFGQSQDKKLNASVYTIVESKPYAPVTGTVLGDNPVLIGAVDLSFKGINLSYWKALDWIGEEGDYDGFFLSRSIDLGKLQVVPKFMHFADFTFSGKDLSAFAIQVKGGRNWKWSTQVNTLIFRSRSPRWIVQPAITKGPVTVNLWGYYEFDQPSLSAGVSYSSRSFVISQRLKGKLQVTYNESLTRLFGSEKGFGQEHTFSMQLSISFLQPSTKKSN
jgi:hypothetical protein